MHALYRALRTQYDVRGTTFHTATHSLFPPHSYALPVSTLCSTLKPPLVQLFNVPDTLKPMLTDFTDWKFTLQSPLPQSMGS